MDNKSLAHAKWECQYHIVFITKYRKKIMHKRARNDVSEIISMLCKYKDVDIYSRSSLQESYTLMLYDKHPELQSKWDKAFGTRGYYVEIIGNSTDEAVQECIKE